MLGIALHPLIICFPKLERVKEYDNGFILLKMWSCSLKKEKITLNTSYYNCEMLFTLENGNLALHLIMTYWAHITIRCYKMLVL